LPIEDPYTDISVGFLPYLPDVGNRERYDPPFFAPKLLDDRAKEDILIYWIPTKRADPPDVVVFL